MSVERRALLNAKIEKLILLINEEHEDFLRIAESLKTLITTQEVSYIKVAQIFVQACTVLRAHFADEEELMKDVYFNFTHPLEHEAHLQQHQQVLHTLDEFSTRFLLANHDTYLSLAQEIDCYFSALRLHIDDEDKILMSMLKKVRQ